MRNAVPEAVPGARRARLGPELAPEPRLAAHFRASDERFGTIDDQLATLQDDLSRRSRRSRRPGRSWVRGAIGAMIPLLAGGAAAARALGVGA